MSLIKLAIEQQKTWTQKHPLLTAGIGLTAGIAAADAGVGIYKNSLKGLPWKEGLSHNLKEGALYGSILSGVEPLVTHGLMGQREKKQ